MKRGQGEVRTSTAHQHQAVQVKLLRASRSWTQWTTEMALRHVPTHWAFSVPFQGRGQSQWGGDWLRYTQVVWVCSWVIDSVCSRHFSVLSGYGRDLRDCKSNPQALHSTWNLLAYVCLEGKLWTGKTALPPSNMEVCKHMYKTVKECKKGAEARYMESKAGRIWRPKSTEPSQVLASDLGLLGFILQWTSEHADCGEDISGVFSESFTN